MEDRRRKTRYWVSARREVPLGGKSWTAQVDVEISCPHDAVLETAVTDLRVRMIEANPGSAVRSHKPLEAIPP